MSQRRPRWKKGCLKFTDYESKRPKNESSLESGAAGASAGPPVLADAAGAGGPPVLDDEWKLLSDKARSYYTSLTVRYRKIIVHKWTSLDAELRGKLLTMQPTTPY